MEIFVIFFNMSQTLFRYMNNIQPEKIVLVHQKYTLQDFKKEYNRNFENSATKIFVVFTT